jgi:hypothetical protein
MEWLNRYLHLHAAPILARSGRPQVPQGPPADGTSGDQVVVAIRDVTHTILE